MNLDQQTINQMLPFLLRRENIARYQDGMVLIGDRRKYPFEEAFVECRDVDAVAAAIKGMVTQGGGPWVAASMGLAMHARQQRTLPADKLRTELQNATHQLKTTRPTSNHLHRLVEQALWAGETALDKGEEPEQAILAWLEAKRDDIYQRSAKMGRMGADLIEDGDGILTMCFAETAFLLGLNFAKQDGKQMQVYVPETRPYLQGARLTAPSVHELGIPVKLVTDNMPAHLVAEGLIQKYFTAADLVTIDGQVVNKIGTLQSALACHFYGVPYFAYSWKPDRSYHGRESVQVEERDPAEIRAVKGVPTTIDALDAYYPAFDITPPHLVAGIITKFGVLSPFDLARYFAKTEEE